MQDMSNYVQNMHCMLKDAKPMQKTDKVTHMQNIQIRYATNMQNSSQLCRICNKLELKSLSVLDSLGACYR